MSTPHAGQGDRLTDQSAQIEIFLGAQAGAGGPFAILGLPHTGLNQISILRACQSRLATINRHTRSNTPAADEVRLAVHTAASQLLDPALCVELAKHWPEGVGGLDQAESGVDAWRLHTTEHLDPQLQSQALRMIAACGGWNRKSRKRLGQFARIHQVPAAMLVNAIIGDAQHSGEQATGNTQETQRSPGIGVPETQSILNRLNDDPLPWMVIPVLYALMAIGLVSAGMYDSLSSVGNNQNEAILGSNVESLSSVQSAQVRTEQTQQTGGVDQGSLSSQRRHYSAILFELDRFASIGLADSEAAEEFSRIADMLCLRWTEVPAREFNKAYLDVLTVLDRILSDDELRVASSFLVKREDSGLRSVMHSAIRSSNFDLSDAPHFKLYRKRSGEEDTVTRLESMLRKQFEIAASQSTDEVNWWVDWKVLCDALDRRSDGVGAAMWQRAARNQMNKSAPNITDGEWARCARLIVQGLDWKAGTSSRAWLIECVKDPKVTTERLAALSNALVIYSSAGGLDLESVLQADASDEQRVAYLQKLREKWASETLADNDTLAQLVDQLGQTLRISEGLAGDQKMVKRSDILNPLLELARVNAACRLRYQQDIAGLAVMIQEFGTPLDNEARQRGAFDLSSSGADEEWATTVRNLTDRDELLNQIDEFDRRTRVGPKSAHALVYLAMQAPDLEVRTQAERSVLVRPDDPAIIFALERVCGDERTSRRMVDLVYDFLKLPDQNRDAQTGRSLLMAELVRVGALESDQGSGLDSLESDLARIWSARSSSTADSSVLGAEQAYRDAILQIARAGKQVPAEIRARLRVALNTARGPLQRSVVFRLATYELISYRIASDSSPLFQGNERIAEQLRLRLELESDAFTQLLIIERAIAEVWQRFLEAEGVS